MLNELGHFTLILALCFAGLQAILGLFGASKGWSGFMLAANRAATAQFALIAISFVALTRAFLSSDFSLAIVVGNSHTAKPFLYKLTGVWGTHEGSLLLWVLILALFAACVNWFGTGLPVQGR